MKYKIQQYLQVALGCLLCSISINLFLVPHHLISGGMTGLAVISNFLFGFPIGVVLFLLNVPLVYAAYRLLGKGYTIKTIFGAVFFSIAVDSTQFLAALSPLDDPILACLTGGIISGLGAGLIFRVNGSAGGVDIIAVIMKKYYSLNVGVTSFAVNMVIVLLATTLFGLKLAILTLLAMYVGATITDKVVEGFNHKKSITIISNNGDKIAAAIIKEVGRGVTILHGEGAFTRQNKQIVFVVVSLTQIAKIKLIVEEVDPCAFMIIQDAAEVMGGGFTLPGGRCAI
ncbi:MAG: YitT family protein [Sporomusaceae bacterium]|nr:YitT family protein [Sporomusaceae bacterium]